MSTITMSISSIGPTTATPSAPSAPLPRSCASRARSSTAASTGWSAAIISSEDLHVRDNLTFGSQYGPFAACRIVALVAANPALRNPAAPGCLSPTGTATLNGAFGAAAPVIIAGLNRLSTVVNVGDNSANYFQDSTNWALFTHNIFNITDTLSLTLGLRYTNENKDFSATFNNTNTICATQQAFFANFLSGGATPLPGGGVTATAGRQPPGASPRASST